MKSCPLFILFLVWMVLISCNPLPASPTSIATFSSPTQESESTTSTIATRVLTNEMLSYQSVDVLSELPTDIDFDGRLILDGHQPVFFDFDNRTFSTIPDGRGDFSVSPNGNWVSYYEVSENSPTGVWLVVGSVDGQQYRLPMQEDWDWGVAPFWLDNQRLVYNIRDVGSLHPAVIINPFTGETQELASDYPNLRPTNLGVGGSHMHFVYSSVVYHPSLDLVIYFETGDDGNFYVVLWDRVAQEPLARLIDRVPFEHAPAWFPDGNQFVIAVRYLEMVDEWFSVSRTGDIRQLTHFGEFFEQTQIGSSAISPDGRYLAFWLKVEPSEYIGANLAILDLETLRVNNYCIPGSSWRDEPRPVWSPDSRYIAISYYYAANSRHVILLDPIDRWAAPIAEDLTPRGWMVAP